MDGATPEGKEGKGTPWTESAKYQLLLRIIAQLKDNRTIKWDLINIPGRNAKSLQNIWTKINKEVQALEAQSAAGGVATPQKSSVKKSGGRGRSKKSDAVVAEAEDDDEDVKPIPCKLASKKKRGPSLLEDEVYDIKRMKVEDEDGLEPVFKTSPDPFASEEEA